MNYSHGVIDRPEGLRDQARELAKLTRELSRCCQTKEEQIFGRFGLSAAEGRVLVAVADNGTATPSGVAGRLGLGRSRLTPLVDSLVQKGLLSRTESVSDRRMRTLDLTEEGRQAAQEVVAYQITFHEELLQRFTPEERPHLLGTLGDLHGVIEEVRAKLSPDCGSPAA